MGQRDVLADLVVGAVPPSVRTTMTEAQISAVRDAVSRSVTKRHMVDVRFTVPFAFARYYVVILAGKDRRAQSLAVGEERRSAASASFTWWTALVWSVLAVALFATVAYVCKSKLGIDLFPWHLDDIL